MSNLRRIAAFLFVLLIGATAHAQGGSRSLDSVDNAASKSLDSVDTGESESLDDADTGQSESLDDAEDAPAAPQASALPQPAALPDIDDADARAQAQSARQAVVVEQQRVKQADAAYSSMMTSGYPQGDARAAIVQERDAAQQAYQQANARYTSILNQLE